MVRGTDDQYTVEELAAAAGVPTRTIRYYQSQGALPPPQRVGRFAYYDADHLERLRLIALLRDRGLRLDAIAEVLDQVVAGGDSLQGWLGLTEFSATSWADEQPVLLSADELRRRCHGDDLLVDELVVIGAIQREMGLTEPYFLVSSPSMLDSLLPMNRRSRLWELYLQHFETIRDEAQDDFHTLFGRAFLAAYEQQLDRLHEQQAAGAPSTAARKP